MELQRIVGGKGDHETACGVFGERVSMIVEEEAVVAERRHGDADAGQVIQVLQNWSLEKSKFSYVM